MPTANPTPTRERIVDEAMRLFSDHGYAGTSVARIEEAAGLYHHFKSKEAVLAAGIQRQLERLAALRQIRSVLGSLGDLPAELKLTARYFLAELDDESELLRILASDVRNRPQVLNAAAEELVASALAGFAGLIEAESKRPLSPAEAEAIAVLGLGSLLSSRVLQGVLGVPVGTDDEALVDAWVQMMLATLGG